ncbi:MAG TPA: PadR family transcriptional regulator [Blastocatellia bacterium]|nr:PadR family transcriptional regulator [Blastocatellia bacterium]
MSKRDEIPYGTLDMLILKTVALGEEMHGFEIADWIQNQSEDVLRVEEGSLYPALQRLMVNGWLTAKWGRTRENRRARYYKLTAAGKRQLQNELEQYNRVTAAIGRILQPA